MSAPIVKSRLVLGIFVAVSAAVLFCFLLFNRRSSPAAGPYERGRMLAEAQMIDAARAAYLEAVEADPAYAPPYRALAEMASRAGALDEAVEYWRQYVTRAPQSEHAWCRLAGAELRAGFQVSARRDAERELKAAPDCPRAHLILGMVFMRKMAAKRALEHLERAARAFGDPRVQTVYAEVLVLAGSYDRAEQVLRGILETDRSRPGPYRWLGTVYARRPATAANRRQAESYLRQALEINPDYPEANVELARLYLQQRRAREALPFLRKAVAVHPHYPEALYLLVRAYAALGRHADAEQARRAFHRERRLEERQEALLKAYPTAPNRTEAALELAKVFLARAEIAAALVFLRDAARQAPQEARLRAEIARVEELLTERRTVLQRETRETEGIEGNIELPTTARPAGRR